VEWALGWEPVLELLAVVALQPESVEDVVALQPELVEDVAGLEPGLEERKGWLAFAILFGKAVEINQGCDRQEGGMGSGDVSKPM
jgi:hypothetical protein